MGHVKVGSTKFMMIGVSRMNVELLLTFTRKYRGALLIGHVLLIGIMG